MKNWEYIIQPVLIFTPQPPHPNHHHSQIQNSLIPYKRWGRGSSRVWVIPGIVLCMTVKCEIPLTDGKGNQHPEKLSLSWLDLPAVHYFGFLGWLERRRRKQDGDDNRGEEILLFSYSLTPLPPSLRPTNTPTPSYPTSRLHHLSLESLF